ncbi:hypothetical protein GU926_16595 [Nibribacter ruber]|uniref:Uncharacterized protein n=1 Tax=Nibribacter ruber TaxID=2698458 RepID=A0A6P1P3G6_9BACT|nr:hypothetical protein [Nibribacter ruber]QHL88959.1 hypothetical protein GU926_16595 [Nibribacter ruber]
MNIDTFASLKVLMENLECEATNEKEALHELQTQCNEILHLIKTLQFTNNSAHVQLATKQALEYIYKALSEIDTKRVAVQAGQNGTVDLHDICGPAHASLEIILNLNYN